jgi:hypothetical protein
MGGSESGISRRTLLERAGLAGAVAVLAQLPGFLSGKGWLEPAHAQSADMVRETLDALVVFVVPGPDPYSVAQGQSTKEPGALDADATVLLVDMLDRFVTVPVAGQLPVSLGVAQLLNGYATEVNPAAAGGTFASPFARLRFEEKAEVFRRFEDDTEGSVVRFISGILMAAIAFVTFTEGTALDPDTRRLKRTPVSWTISSYDGAAEGWPELKGYWQGRRRVHTSAKYRVGP